MILEVQNATCDTRKLKIPRFLTGGASEANFLFDGRPSGGDLFFNFCGRRRRGFGPVRQAPAAAAAAAKIAVRPSVRPSASVRPRPSVRVRPRPSIRPSAFVRKVFLRASGFNP